MELKWVNGEAPRCPRCEHHNAMLHDVFGPDREAFKCRDCGHVQTWSGFEVGQRLMITRLRPWSNGAGQRGVQREVAEIVVTALLKNGFSYDSTRIIRITDAYPGHTVDHLCGGMSFECAAREVAAGRLQEIAQ